MSRVPAQEDTRRKATEKPKNQDDLLKEWPKIKEDWRAILLFFFLVISSCFSSVPFALFAFAQGALEISIFSSLCHLWKT
jgi:hypothetical protein